jgi:hypothetical protein
MKNEKLSLQIYYQFSIYNLIKDAKFIQNKNPALRSVAISVGR